MPQPLLGEPIETAEGQMVINIGPQHPSTHGRVAFGGYVGRGND